MTPSHDRGDARDGEPRLGIIEYQSGQAVDKDRIGTHKLTP
jgi:hypothetical protein